MEVEDGSSSMDGSRKRRVWRMRVEEDRRRGKAGRVRKEENSGKQGEG